MHIKITNRKFLSILWHLWLVHFSKNHSQTATKITKHRIENTGHIGKSWWSKSVESSSCFNLDSPNQSRWPQQRPKHGKIPWINRSTIGTYISFHFISFHFISTTYKPEVIGFEIISKIIEKKHLWQKVPVPPWSHLFCHQLSRSAKGGMKNERLDTKRGSWYSNISL